MLIPVTLAGRAARRPPPLLTTPRVERLIREGAAVAFGGSGGKDSAIVACVTNAYLDERGHTGPRVLIHAHLGDLVEWSSSREECERLARHLGLDLLVVRPPESLDEGFYSRWERNLARYSALACVRLILPWSTPSMRFCTSQWKPQKLFPALIKRYPGRTIVSVTGIRGQESANRARAPILARQEGLVSATGGTRGYDYHPVRDYTIDDVLDGLVYFGLPLHEAYTRFGAPQVSCALCILAGEAGHRAALRDSRNHPLFLRYVRLEAISSFAFQGDRWLGDLAPELLPPHVAVAHAEAKVRARRRQAAEARIPARLLYAKGGWPTCVPTSDEAALLAGVRAEVSDIMGIALTVRTPAQIIDRYASLLAEKERKEREKADRDARRAVAGARRRGCARADIWADEEGDEEGDDDKPPGDGEVTGRAAPTARPRADSRPGAMQLSLF